MPEQAKRQNKMTDKVSVAKRSDIMRRVRSQNTKPEIVVRKMASALGFKYRLNAKNLPGKPDLSNKSRKKAIFVHGCFWHRHANCKMASTPASNMEYWTKKFESNVVRDRKNMAQYKSMDWKILVIWECELKDIKKLKKKMNKFLES